MKYKFITNILLLMVWAYTPVCAQTLSFEGGYLATKYRNMPPFEDSKGGFTLGVMYAKGLSLKNVYVKTGLHYQQLDGKGTINYTNQINQVVLSYEKTQELYYLQIPLLLDWTEAIRIKKLSIGVQGGFTYSYLLRAWQNPQREGVDHNVTSQFNRNVLGYQAGVYAAIPVSATAQLQLLYRYSGSLTAIQKDISGSAFATNTFSLGLAFNLSKKEN